MQESFDWLQPSPLWVSGPARATQHGFFQPQILEFSDDNFIGAAMTAAAARDTTGFRGAVLMQKDSTPLKLYQPAHGRYYLVTATLVCRIPGFPDREINAADGEEVFFVLRRYIDGQEFAWVDRNGDKSWRPLNGNTRTVLDGEEHLTLSPMPGADGRTVFAGYIPVASREGRSVPADVANAALTVEEKDALKKNSIDTRIEDFEARFVTPLKNEVLAAPSSAITPPSVDISVYILLNLWEFFRDNSPDVAAALRGDAGAPTPTGAAGTLMRVLANQHLASGKDLATALGDVAKQAAALDQAGDAGIASLGFGSGYDLSNATIDLPGVETAVTAALAALPAGAPAVLIPQQGGPDAYAIRCVYVRPQCTIPVASVSQPSPRFQLAAFFDANAPARPVRIVLPTDVSVGAMRKFNKGVTFIISDALQKKLNLINGKERAILQEPTPGLGAEDGGIGFMCSFSIQIIFIVAFFLLIMFVIILNFVFWWIAFFRICLPLPKKLLPG
jgi:hypothetical protein